MKGGWFEGIIYKHLKNDFPRKIVYIILDELKVKPNDSYLLYQTSKTYYVNKMYSKASTFSNRFYNYFTCGTEEFIGDDLITYIYTITKINEFEKVYRLLMMI